MAQNLFSITDQTELNAVVHRPQDICSGKCEWCSKFHRAVTSIGSTDITLTENAKPVGVDGRFQAWCNDCSDGENTNFWDACDWADRHAAKRHNH